MPTTTPLSRGRNALLALALFAGLAACGPAPSDNPANVETQASVGGPPESQRVSQNSLSSHHDPVPPPASPSSLASGRAPDGHGEARPTEPLGVPEWVATALKSPDVQVRL